MPKRPFQAAAPSTSPKEKKRSKTNAGQPSLDKFFGASPTSNKIVASPRKDKGKARIEQTPDNGGKGISAADRRSASSGDQALDLTTVWFREQTKTRGLASSGIEPPEIIDVDLLDEESRPSSSRPLSTTVEAAQHDKDEGPSQANQKGVSTSAVVLEGKVDTRDGSPFQPIITSTAENSNINVAVTGYSDLSLDPLTFSVHPGYWSQGSPIPYSFLAQTLSTLTATRSRILILNTLTNTLRVIHERHPASLLPALYLLSNTLAPPYEPVELGLGHSVISKSIQHVSGLTAAALKRLYNSSGDPGDVAFEAKSNVRTLIPHPPLTIIAVYESLWKIARAKGQGAAKQKQSMVEKLLLAAKGEEVRFLVRTLCQNLRVGAVRTSILTALARAMVLTSAVHAKEVIPASSPYHANPELVSRVSPLAATPDANKNSSKLNAVDQARQDIIERFTRAEALVRRVFVQRPNYDHIVAALLEAGLDGLEERAPLTVGIPLHPTLGSPTRSLDEIYDRLGDLPFTAEFKYDGQRAQIHARRDNEGNVLVKTFSRHLEDMTDKYPDVTHLVEHMFSNSPDLDSFMIDAEIVAVDAVTGDLKSFQELSNRARKDVQLSEVKISVCVFAFDLMYLNEQILLEMPFRRRRSLLQTTFPPLIPQQKGTARLAHVESCESESGREAIDDFWQKAVESRSEGLMIKLLDSGEVLQEPGTKKDRPRRKPLPATYEPDKRTSAWLKLKKDYVQGLGDSLDLVPVGAWHGNGRKAQWWSPILLALRDPETDRLVAVCKCMSGFTDEFYKALKERYPENSETCSKDQLWDCDTGGLKPEVYFRPQEVWEIRGADVTLSPVSVAALGLVSQTRGFSLRFPRFMRVRDDKTLQEASSPAFLARMYNDQQKNGNGHGGADEGELVDPSVESGESEGDESV